MATDDVTEETAVNDRGMVTVPAAIRRRLDIDAGDALRWTVRDDGLDVEVVRHRYGAFEGFEPVAMGGAGGDDHDLMGVDRERRETVE